MAWSSVPGSGNLITASSDTIATGTVSAQSLSAGYAYVGIPTTTPTSFGMTVIAHIGATAPTSGAVAANDGCLFVQSGQLMFLTGTGSVHALTGA